MTSSNPSPVSQQGMRSARRLRNEIWMAGIWILWAVLFAGGMQLLRRGLLPAGPISWAVAILPSVVAALVVVAYSRFLRQADELQRLIQLQAMAVGFGGGFFAICGYALFEQLGAPPAGIDVAALMPILYGIGILVGHCRYQ